MKSRRREAATRMNLNVSTRNGRTYMYIEKGYRDANGKPRKKNIKTIGYAD